MGWKSALRVHTVSFQIYAADTSTVVVIAHGQASSILIRTSEPPCMHAFIHVHKKRTTPDNILQTDAMG